MSSYIKPLLVVMVPLVGFSSLHLFLSVVAPPLMEAAGLAPAWYGLIAGALGFGSIWLFMSNHAMTPALGPLRSLQTGLLIMIAGVLLIMTAITPLMVLGAVLLGFGYSTGTPAGSQILADHTPREKWSTIFSLRQAGVPAGGVIAGGVGGWLITQFGWRPAFVIIGLLCMTLSLPLLLAPRHYNTTRPLRPFRLIAIFDPLNLRRPFLALKLAPGLIRLALVCVGFAIGQGAFFSFYVIYFNSGLGYDLALSGAMFAVFQGTGVLGRIVFGFVADRIGSPRPVLMALAAGSAASSLLLAALGPGHGPLFLFAVSVFTGTTVATWNGLYLAEAAALAPPDAVSEVTAGTTFFVFLTYTITPPVFGLIISSFGYGSAFMVAAVGAACSGILLFNGRTSEEMEGRLGSR